MHVPPPPPWPAVVAHVRERIAGLNAFPIWDNDQVDDCLEAALADADLARGHRDNLSNVVRFYTESARESVPEIVQHWTGQGAIVDSSVLGDGPQASRTEIRHDLAAQGLGIAWVYFPLSYETGPDSPYTYQASGVFGTRYTNPDLRNVLPTTTHAVMVYETSRQGIEVVSWGKKMLMTWAYWDKYQIEIFGLGPSLHS